MIKNKKIIITGGAGFIGKSLINYLVNSYPKNTIISIDRRPTDGIHKHVVEYKQDINYGLPSIQEVDTVIHLAALPSVRDSERKSEDIIMDNILATQNIIRKCIYNWHPKKLLIASSSSVYDGRKNSLMFESDSWMNLHPLSSYAWSKLACEQMVKMYMANGMLNGIQPILMRIFTVFGPHQRDDLSIRAVIDACLKGIPFTLYGDGAQRRDFCYITDTCKAIEALMNSDNLKSTIYNIGTGNNISINEVIHRVSMTIGKPITVKHEPATIYDTNYTLADIAQIAEDTGWKPEVEFDIGLKKQIEWQRNEINK